MQCEGGDEEAVKATVKKTIETFGRIDVLINNAQASKSGVLLENHTKEDFDLAIYSGLYATFFFMRECFPYLKETKGAVINFASGAGLFGSRPMRLPRKASAVSPALRQPSGLPTASMSTSFARLP